MYLTKEEEKMLEGELGEAVQRAMEILVALGDIYGAKEMVKISSAHLSGVSYKTIGEGGLLFLEDFLSLGAKFRVPTTINPCGVDLENWKQLQICDEEFVKKQRKIVDCYLRMGALPSLTCTPYYGSNVPRFGDHVAWAESSAVIYANSVIGARTNREGAPSALAAAIVGRTPKYGLHLKEDRRGKEKVLVKVDLTCPADYGALGLLLGELGVKLPYLIAKKKAYMVNVGLKYLGAALAASGDVAMFHFEGITPEASKLDHEFEDKIEIGEREIKEIFEKYHTEEEPELYAFGCPHLGKEELEFFLHLKPRKETWLSVGKDFYEKNRELIERLKEKGYKVISGTCFVVSTIENKYRVTATNSGKAAKYLPSFCHQRVLFGKAQDLLGDSREGD